MIERYRTIKENGQSEIEIKKSRFICSLRRIESEDQAKNFIQEIKKEHWMMENQVERRAYRCWKSSKKIN